jgi:hypothetical protein
MADGVTDTSHWEDVAGVASALLGAAPHRKRASTPADPATLHVHLHRRSSSLVSLENVPRQAGTRSHPPAPMLHVRQFAALK